MAQVMTDADAAETVAALEAHCQRIETPCGDGAMLWRAWGDGPPLVLLHGAFGSWLHWVRNIEALSGRFRVLAADMPGYGASALPPEPYTAESLADIMVRGLRQILGGQPFHLAGFSLGGILGGPMAAALGAQMRTLILIGPNGMGLPFPEMPVLRRPDPGMSEAGIAAMHRHNLGLLMLSGPEHADDLAVHVQQENARQARAKSAGIPAGDALLRALPGIRARIGGLFGTADVFCGSYLDDRERILRRFQPDLDFRRIAGAGHWLPYERPDEVNAAILEMTGV